MIAYLAHRFPVATETFTYDEVGALARRGLEPVVFSFRPGDALDWPLEGTKVRLLPRARSGAYAAALGYWAVRRPFRLLRAAVWAALGRFPRRPTRRERLAALFALPRGALLARERRVRLYHAQFANETATAALIAGYLAGRQFSFRSHTAPNPQLLGLKLRRAALVLSIGERDRASLLAVEPRARVEVARLGVELPSDAEPKEAGLVVSVGSLIEKKGHHVLIDACRILTDEGVAFRCEIAGDGWMRGELESRIERLGLGGRVLLRGHLDREKALRLLRRASVCVLASVPSEREGEDGVPVVLVEALARRTPCVASELSGIPEVVVHELTGLLVPPGDAAALAAAIRRILRDGELSRFLGEAGREHVAERYEREACYARAAELLASAAG